MPVCSCSTCLRCTFANAGCDDEQSVYVRLESLGDAIGVHLEDVIRVQVCIRTKVAGSLATSHMDSEVALALPVVDGSDTIEGCLRSYTSDEQLLVVDGNGVLRNGKKFDAIRVRFTSLPFCFVNEFYFQKIALCSGPHFLIVNLKRCDEQDVRCLISRSFSHDGDCRFGIHFLFVLMKF